jgi:hypothetical protein
MCVHVDLCMCMHPCLCMYVSIWDLHMHELEFFQMHSITCCQGHAPVDGLRGSPAAGTHAAVRRVRARWPAQVLVDLRNWSQTVTTAQGNDKTHASYVTHTHTHTAARVF